MNPNTNLLPSLILGLTVLYNVDVEASAGLFAQKIILITGVITTLIINPWYGFDPINLPKMLIVSAGSGFLLGWFISIRSHYSLQFNPIVLTTILFALTLIISFFSNSAPWYQQLWGTWGRSTGLLTYISFLIVMLASLFFVNERSMQELRVTFERLGYFITGYTLIQLMDLDPITWSQKALVATLGNINFMSSFLGLVSISYISQILNHKLHLLTKTFYFILTFVNLSIILFSKSIQGLGVFLAGFTLLLSFKIRTRLSFLNTMIFFIVTTCIGLITLIGTAGFGPFSRIKQDTVLFRIDYWTAGMRMLRANLLDGVGIDSYGDYYREYRSIEAITRTGPQRVTNTAHNIFLDIFAGAGLLAGILFLMLVLLTGFSIIKSLRSNNFVSLDFQALCAMWFGFVVFCLISINQIGVGIWGFIFMGAINGCMAKFNSGDLESFQKPATLKRAIKKSQLFEKSRLKSDKNIVKSGKIIRVSLSFFLAAIMFCMALIPNWADAKYLATVKNKDLDAARAIVEVKGIQDYHVENLISSLEIAGRPKDALDLALSLSERNPRNWDAWVHIVSSSVSTSEQKDVAARRLLQLDPKNVLVREELRKLSIP